jgi:hypothetical protein
MLFGVIRTRDSEDEPGIVRTNPGQREQRTVPQNIKNIEQFDGTIRDWVTRDCVLVHARSGWRVPIGQRDRAHGLILPTTSTGEGAVL